MPMPLFPMFLKLEGRRCVVIGAGKLAEPKIESLLNAGARVFVVAPQATPRIAQWSSEEKINWTRRKFRARSLAGAFLVIAATGLPEINARIFTAARRRGILCNAVDDPLRCDFFYSAVLRRGPLQIAISTNGASPALAQTLRRELDHLLSPDFGAWVARLGKMRRKILAQGLPPARRRKILCRIATPPHFHDFLKHRSESAPARSR